MDCYGIAKTALDVAVEIDRAMQGRRSDLSGCIGLADALRAAWDEGDPTTVDDMLAALTPREGAVVTVDDLASSLDADVALLRRAGAGEADALAPSLARCLRIHRALLARDMERFGPYGLVA